METSDELRFDHGDETPERLKGQLSRLVGMTAAQTRRVAGDALGAVGAHKDHFVVLAALAEFGPASQVALSGRTPIYKSDLVSVLNDLADGGWIRRTPDPADGRYTLAILTDLGRAKAAEAAPGHVEEVRRLVFDPLTKAQSRQLREIGRRIMRAIDQDDRSVDD